MHKFKNGLMASIDRMDWHGSNFPADLPLHNRGTHIGMYLTWIIDNDLIGEQHWDDSADAIQKVLHRQMTGRDFLIIECDEKFWNEDLNDEGNAFTEYYYQSNRYVEDYAHLLAGDVDSIYKVDNSWENYHRLRRIIDLRYEEWKANRST